MMSNAARAKRSRVRLQATWIQSSTFSTDLFTGSTSSEWEKTPTSKQNSAWVAPSYSSNKSGSILKYCKDHSPMSSHSSYKASITEIRNGQPASQPASPTHEMKTEKTCQKDRR